MWTALPEGRAEHAGSHTASLSPEQPDLNRQAARTVKGTSSNGSQMCGISRVQEAVIKEPSSGLSEELKEGA